MGKSKELAELGDVVTQDGGNMLVGTTGHFNYSGGTTEITVGTSGTGSNAGGAVTFVSNNGATTLGYTGFQESEALIGTMGSRPLKLTTDNTARMVIDASGRVTKPYTPAFMAAKSSHQTGSGTVVFDDVDFNVGNHYNGTNGLFTAPVAGVYVFTFATLLYSMGGSTRAQLLVNGSAAGSQTSMGTYGAFTGSYAGQGASMVTQLSANDVVQIYCHHNTTNFHSYYTWWSGYQLG